MTENIKDQRNHTHGSTDKDDWQRHVEAALAECAAAKFLGRYWPGKGKLYGNDISGGFDVRVTAKDSNRLIIHKEDPDNRVFLFLVGAKGCYTIKGWIRAREAKRPDWWADPSKENRPAYFVPNSELHPISEL